MEENEWIKLLEETFNGECIDMFSAFNQGEFKILSIIASHGSITASAIVDIANVSAARMSKIIHHLLGKGLIKCVNHKLDKRKVIITISDKGQEVFDKGKAFLSEMFQELKENVGEESLIGFIKTSKEMKKIFIENEKRIKEEAKNA